MFKWIIIYTLFISQNDPIGVGGNVQEIFSAVLSSPAVVAAMQCDVSGSAMRRFAADGQSDKYMRYFVGME